MRNHYEKILSRIELDGMLADLKNLLERERPQTSAAHDASAVYSAEALKRIGASDVRVVRVPADGKTVYLDKTMPLGWSASKGKLTVVSAAGYGAGEVIADYAEHPFHLISGSVSTQKGGIDVPLVTEKAFHQGTDVKGALILLEQATWPRRGILTPVLDRGAIGIVSCFLRGAELYPDSFQWVVASTETRSWHVTKKDRDFISFCISPNEGTRLRTAADVGPVLLHAESDGKRFETKMSYVTGIIPGRRKEEVWLTAHLYEPLADDNSSGIAAVVETMRQIHSKGMPEFTVRAIFAMEVYGFAAYAASRNLPLHKEVIGGCNYDGIYHKKINFTPAGPALPYFGNAILRLLYHTLRNGDIPEVTISRTGHYFDDIWISDPTIGVPSVWPIHADMNIWHNSIQDIDYIKPDLLRRASAIYMAIADALANPSEKIASDAADAVIGILPALRAEAEKFDDKAEAFAYLTGVQRKHLADFGRILDDFAVQPLLAAFDAAAQDAAAGLPCIKAHDEIEKQYRRLVPGIPCDLCLATDEYRYCDLDFMYEGFSFILTGMDGKTPFETLLRRAEYEEGRPFSEEEKDRYRKQAEYLVKWGYIA